LALADSSGAPVPVQSWPLAYWPDGSLKWTGHAVDPSATAAGFRLAPGTPGASLIRSLSRGTQGTANSGQFVLLLQGAPDGDDGTPDGSAHRTEWSAYAESAEIEQSGPVRAVVKLTG